MKPFVTSLLLSISLPAICIAQQPKQPKLPAIPTEIEATERGMLSRAALQISQSQFDEASAVIKPLSLPDKVRVYVDWTPIPEARRTPYRQAVEAALQAWNQGLLGATDLQLVAQEDGADLRVFFEQGVVQIRSGQVHLVCVDSTPDLPTGGAQPARRTARVRVALNAPYTETAHSPDSITHLVGQGVGMYLGLAMTAQEDGVMGPDTHRNPPVRPSKQELDAARQAQLTRVQLLDFARKKIAGYLPKAVLTVAKSEIDAGDVAHGDKAHYVFTVKNTGDAPLEIDAKPNCGCTVAHFDRVIAPGAEGKIEAEMLTTGFRGRVIKQIDVRSNDLITPLASLRLLANVQSIVEVVPSDRPLIALKESGPTVKELELRSSAKEPVEILRVNCGAPYATAAVTAMPDVAGKGKAYKVALTVQPDAPMGRSAFVVTAYTNSPREPQINITVVCSKGILAMPPSIYLGSLRPGTPLPVTQVVTLTKESGAFHLRRAQCDDPNVRLKQEILQDGTQYRITVSYMGGWPAGSVRRNIVIETDDAVQPKIEIPIAATVTADLGAKR